MRRIRIVAGVALALSSCSLLVAGDWPRYRGPNGDAISTEPAFAEIDSLGFKVEWRRKIGSGYSGISIADGRVVTMFSDGGSDVLAAFDEASGAELWRREIEPTHKGHDGSHDGPIATPLIHDGRVFTISARGRLLALDFDTGSPLWTIDLVEKYEAVKPHYGFATSPIVHGGVLIVEVGGDDRAILGLDPATGERKWSAGSDTIDCQSPAPVTFGGRSLVLAAGRNKLIGLDAASGEILLEYDHGGEGWRGARSMTPVPAGDDRVFLAYKDDSSSMVRLVRKGDAIVAEQIWEGRSIRNSYNVPVYHEGHLYAYSNRFLTCVDAATGETVWRSRQPGDGFVTLVDGHLVIVTKQGGLHVARATPRGYEEIGGRELFDDLAWTAPSFANGHIFVRSLDEMARVSVGRGFSMADPRAEGSTPGSGSSFAAFLAEVESASDKKAVVDRWMSSVESFPVVEGNGQVRFIYRGAGEDLAVAGDMIGHRQERPMTRVPGTDLFYYTTVLEPDARVSYVFIRDYEEITDPLNPRKTLTMVVDGEMEPRFDESATMEISWLAMPQWKPAPHLTAAGGTPSGRIESHRLASEHLDTEHEIEVYLPPGYDDSDRRYPVVIVHGGEAARDRGGLIQALDRLGGSRVESLILVFVKTFSPMGGHEPYSAMISEELIPFIDRTYRSIPSREGRAHIGAGFSGYTALYCAFKRPAEAAKVGTHSAVMLDFMRSMLEPLPSAAEHPFEIYMDWGKYDLRNPDEAWDMVELNENLTDLLRERGHALAGRESHEGPGWAIWQNRIDDLLSALFPANPSGAEYVTGD